MASTTALGFGPLVDETTGRAQFVPDRSIAAPQNEGMNAQDIAPWDEPPSPIAPPPPPKNNTFRSIVVRTGLRGHTNGQSSANGRPFEFDNPSGSSITVNISEASASSATLVSSSTSRQAGASTTSFSTYHGRPSDASTLNIPDPLTMGMSRESADTLSLHSAYTSTDFGANPWGSTKARSEGKDGQQIRKSKSSMFSNIISRKKSKQRMRSDSFEEQQHISLQRGPPPLPEHMLHPVPSLPGLAGKDRKDSSFSSRIKDKGKRRAINVSESPTASNLDSEWAPEPPPKTQELNLSSITDFNDIDGIVNPRLGSGPIQDEPPSFRDNMGHTRTYSSENSFGSTSFAGESASGHSLGPIAPSEFHNPFGDRPIQTTFVPAQRTTSLRGREQVSPDRRVSPSTVVNGPLVIRTNEQGGEAVILEGEGPGGDASLGPRSPSWVPPESWDINSSALDEPDAGDASSGDEHWEHDGGGGTNILFAQPGGGTSDIDDIDVDSFGLSHSVRSPSSVRSWDGRSDGTASSSGKGKSKSLSQLLPGKRRPSRPQHYPLDPMSRLKEPIKTYKIRIYRSNNTYHYVSVGFRVTVSSLTPKLKERLLGGETREVHKLYLKERGRERLLAPTERPADIVRRRLEQAGYDVSDGMELLETEGLSFLLKFIFKSAYVGPAEEEGKFDDYALVDLTGRGLRTIPLALHRHADSIMTLSLSRNPMLEIPLDFIQSCTSLQQLRLSHMAMKKVPHSVKNCPSLLRLDISCNRIADLDEALLDQITGLTELYVQNNRMEKLSWYFPRMRNLVVLNISNNKFRTVPLLVCDLPSLRELDVSFNMIHELPAEIGKLTKLEKLIIVGNHIAGFPPESDQLVNLRTLDCRRNALSNLGQICMLPRLEKVSADHNCLHALDLSLGPNLRLLDVASNEITKLSSPNAGGTAAYALTSLDLSHARLASFGGLNLTSLPNLKHLKIDYNKFPSIPESLGDLEFLETLSCADNDLAALPASIGRLQRLETLDAHNNNLTDLPATLWNCMSLKTVNMTSNLLSSWQPPPVHGSMSSTIEVLGLPGAYSERKGSAVSTTSLGASRVPPLALSLQKLYLGENHFTDDALLPLTIFKELIVLNLSFNDLQDLPTTFFRSFSKLVELYLSGNKLASIPTEDLPKLTKLSVLYLNGNRLQTLPQELGKVQSLTVLDVGSNSLKYNINNWEFDWNWNFNKNLRYLNLSGNKRLQIKSDVSKSAGNSRFSRDYALHRNHSLAGFTDLTHLRVLGLMDVTITATAATNASIDIPDETADRRVRTSQSTVGGMSYGIADTLGKHDHLNMLDLVHEFPGRKGEAVFAMFGRAAPPNIPGAAGSNRIAKFLHDSFIPLFTTQLAALQKERGDEIPDGLRRAFLLLNTKLHDALFSTKNTRKGSTISLTPASDIIPGGSLNPGATRGGASGIVLYFRGKELFVANVGNALAVVSRGGTAHAISHRHDPYDRQETSRIRAAEGWVSPAGLVNDELDISRSFGFFHLLPMVNARPTSCRWELTELDEFVIVGNRGLWDYVSNQTAIDMARRELGDPMIAAQKLRDLAMSYGADGSTMVMVIGVSDLFKTDMRFRQDSIDYNKRLPRKPPKGEIQNINISRLPFEIPPPTGHVTLAFTDIRNSTHLWEVNPGTPIAIRMHNDLLRRQLRFCGGYEVKTEGDAFICSFYSPLSALRWCLEVQKHLLEEDWPLEILECIDGQPVHDLQKRLIARGLSVRMGIHCGMPLCEPDPITHRMDYFGPMVNRTARIAASAQGGQIMCSADVIREVNSKVFETEPETEFAELHPPEAVDAVKRIGIVVKTVGEVRLKGLEVPEIVSAVYPVGLESRHNTGGLPEPASSAGSRVPFSVKQMRELGVLCLRLEMLTTGRTFRTLTESKGNLPDDPRMEKEQEDPRFLYGSPGVLLPPMDEKSSDNELMLIMDSLSGRIENALAALVALFSKDNPRQTSGSGNQLKSNLADELTSSGMLDTRTLETVLELLQSLK